MNVTRNGQLTNNSSTAKSGMTEQRPETRIQKRNKELILEAALEVFSTYGFRGSTIDQIAAQAGLSKPNLLYYFPSKESMHVALLDRLLDTWLDPLRALQEDGDPIEEILSYVSKKLEMSQKYPRESRLFANEIIQGAPRILGHLEGDLRRLVDEKAEVIKGWTEAGRIATVHPYHLIFSVWSLTQHYADFEVQVQAILPKGSSFDEAEAHLHLMFRRLLTV